MILNYGAGEDLESPLDCKEIQSVHPKGNQSWIFTGRTNVDAEAETVTLWPPDAKNWLIGKDPVLEKIEERRRRRQQRIKWLDGITDLMGMSLSRLQQLVMEGKPGMLQSMGSQRVRPDWETELNWTVFDAEPLREGAFFIRWSHYPQLEQYNLSDDWTIFYFNNKISTIDF